MDRKDLAIIWRVILRMIINHESNIKSPHLEEVYFKKRKGTKRSCRFPGTSEWLLLETGLFIYLNFSMPPCRANRVPKAISIRTVKMSTLKNQGINSI